MTERGLVLTLIPARGGSKGVPGKNIRPLAGKPLVVHTIEAALQAKSVSRVVVSTDSPAIAGVAKASGAEVPFLRPASLAADVSTSASVVSHALEWFHSNEQYSPDLVLLAQPTSPLRTSVHIDKALERFSRFEDAEGLVAVTEVSESPYWMKCIGENGYLLDFLPVDRAITRRQDSPPLYMPNGSIYIVRRSVFLSGRSLYPSKTIPFVMDQESSIDIDTELDFIRAEMVLNLRATRAQ